MDEPLYASLRSDANNQYTFLEFVVGALERRKLVRGDVLVLDNATVHHGNEIFRALVLLLEAAGVQLVFLPKYSPELSPCECVFAQVKNRLRYRRGRGHFTVEIIMAIANISHAMLTNFYHRCVQW